MGIVLSISDITRQRPKSLRGEHLVAKDLEAYAAQIDVIVQQWEQEELGELIDSTEISEVGQAGRIVVNCIELFVESAGNWCGRWPRFANSPNLSRFSSRCADRVYWRLSGVLLNDFAPKVIGAYSRAIETGEKLHIKFNADLDTLLALKQFVGQLSDEILQQSRFSTSP